MDVGGGRRGGADRRDSAKEGVRRDENKLRYEKQKERRAGVRGGGEREGGIKGARKEGGKKGENVWPCQNFAPVCW